MFLIPSTATWNFKSRCFPITVELHTQSEEPAPRRGVTRRWRRSREKVTISRGISLFPDSLARDGKVLIYLSQLLLTSAFFTVASSLGLPVAVSPREMAAPEQPLPMSRGCQSSVSLSPPRGDRTLLVRHLPAELTAEEKEDLLKYFGAQSVRVLSDKGRLVRARPSLASWEGPGRVPRRVGALAEEDRTEWGSSACVVGAFLFAKCLACQVKF